MSMNTSLNPNKSDNIDVGKSLSETNPNDVNEVGCDRCDALHNPTRSRQPNPSYETVCCFVWNVWCLCYHQTHGLFPSLQAPTAVPKFCPHWTTVIWLPTRNPLTKNPCWKIKSASWRPEIEIFWVENDVASFHCQAQGGQGGDLPVDWIIWRT